MRGVCFVCTRRPKPLCFQTCSHSPHKMGLCPSSQGTKGQLSQFLGQGEETAVGH